MGKMASGATLVPPKSFESSGKLVMGKANNKSFQLMSARTSLNLLTVVFFRQQLAQQQRENQAC